MFIVTPIAKIGAHDDWLRTCPHGYRPMSPASPRRPHRGARQDIDGLLAWAAGSDENGLHVVTVWQSRAHQERWAAEQLFPVFQELGMTGVPVDSEFTEYETGELYVR